MFVIEFFNSIAEYLMLYILGCIFADVSLRNIRKNVVLILIFSFMQMDLTMFTAELQVLYNVSVTVSYFVYIVLQFLFFAAVFYHSEDSFLEIPSFFRSKYKLINIVCMFSFIDALLMIVHIAGNMISYPDYNIFRIHYGLESLAAGGILLVIHFRFAAWNLFQLIEKNHPLKYFVVNSYLIILFLYHIQQKGSSITVIMWCSFTLLFLNFLLFYYEYRLEMKQLRLKDYEEYLPLIDELIKDIRSRQHSYQNLVQSITSLPYTCPDYATLTAALEKYGNCQTVSEEDSALLKLNLKLVAGFLISKKAQAEEQNKKLHIQNDVFLQCMLPEYLLIEIMGILIDNALEATQENGEVFLKLQNRKKKLYLNIRNKGPVLSEKQREQIFRYGYTTKTFEKSRHGLGLSRLNKLVNSYNGMLALSNEAIDNEMYIVFELEV